MKFTDIKPNPKDYSREDIVKAFQDRYRYTGQLTKLIQTPVKIPYHIFQKEPYLIFDPAIRTVTEESINYILRPDSGDPVDIVTGTKTNGVTPEEKGLIECLWDTFGGTINEQGYKVLDPHIGAIYGDSITLERATAICKRLEAKGFATTNIVFGIGSFSYQYHTRDTFGFAVKATAAMVNGQERMLFKDPKTDDGTKRSQRGRIVVARKADVLAEDPNFDTSTLTGDQSQNNLIWKDGLTEKEAEDSHWNALQTVFVDGKLLVDESLTTIRERVHQN